MSSTDKRSPEEQAAEMIAQIFVPQGDDFREAAANFAEGMSRTRPEGAQIKAEREILRILCERYGICKPDSPDRHTYAPAMYAALFCIGCMLLFFAWIALQQFELAVRG